MTKDPSFCRVTVSKNEISFQQNRPFPKSITPLTKISHKMFWDYFPYLFMAFVFREI